MASGVSTFIAFLLTTGMLQYVSSTDSRVQLFIVSRPVGSTLSLECPECSCWNTSTIGITRTWDIRSSVQSYDHSNIRSSVRSYNHSVKCSQPENDSDYDSGRVTINGMSFTLTLHTLEYGDRGYYDCQCYQHAARYSVTVLSDSSESLWYVWLIVAILLLIVIIIIICCVKKRRKNKRRAERRLRREPPVVFSAPRPDPSPPPPSSSVVPYCPRPQTPQTVPDGGNIQVSVTEQSKIVLVEDDRGELHLGVVELTTLEIGDNDITIQQQQANVTFIA